MKQSNINKEAFRVFSAVNDLQLALGKDAIVKLSAFDETPDAGKKLIITVEYAKWTRPKLDKVYG